MKELEGIFLPLKYFIKSVKFIYKQKNSNTYYPDYPQHGIVKMILDNCRWAKRNGSLNNHYFLYGMDRKGDGIDVDEYLPYREHMDILEGLLAAFEASERIQICTEDKREFSRLAGELGFNVPKILARVTAGVVHPTNDQIKMDLVTFLESLDTPEVFCKPVTGTK